MAEDTDQKVSKNMGRVKIAAFFERLAKADPEPETELHFTNDFTLLVAVVLSAQATDKGVNRATQDLFKAADNAEAMMRLGEAKIRGYIKTIGLYRTKAKNVYALSKQICENHNGAIPDSREALMALPGVGRKTANVVMNVAFGQATFAVDTHVFRLCNRTGLALGKNVEAVEKGLEVRVPEPYRVSAHHWLILHGRYICLARKPKCGICPVADLCNYPHKEK